MGRPKRRNRAPVQSIETLANALPHQLRNPDMEPRDRLPAIGGWLRAHMVDPALALDVANAAGLGIVEWSRSRLSAPGAADEHPVYRSLSVGLPEPPSRETRPDLRVVE
ncbi:hypothetical protein BMW24_013820 [Mycobacterium heckeshornense]|uniref:Uncharacterized protein n=1 Tax=Mycobacterium heckeshornense TaxID=110505 RepID=A0A2G8B8H4_9MYCO|nr:hypothetical protein BMW24_013820 [Mycobacterium heckeshornense]BCO37434.1 hypothetical protein MHEC_38670 [Mycobacterium heckeshornense]